MKETNQQLNGESKMKKQTITSPAWRKAAVAEAVAVVWRKAAAAEAEAEAAQEAWRKAAVAEAEAEAWRKAVEAAVWRKKHSL